LQSAKFRDAKLHGILKRHTKARQASSAHEQQQEGSMLKTLGLALIASVSMMGTASASKLTEDVAYARAGSVSTPPIGWVEFCDNPAHRADCDVPQLRPSVAKLDEARWQRMLAINANVNQKVVAITDLDQWGVAERWSYPTTGKGDCEDYVLEKRRQLIQAGFPRQSLLITVVRDKKGEGHAVLLVKTDRGDFILDNAEAKVLIWFDTGYRFVKRQSEESPNTWVSLGNVHSKDIMASTRR
jgi:predicted transglutaminase-like cysteine proteinase